MHDDAEGASPSQNSIRAAAGTAVAAVGSLIGLVIASAQDTPNQSLVAILTTASLAMAGIAILLLLLSAQQSATEAQQRQLNARLKATGQAENARHSTTASWDVAVVKLESYLDRNLEQVRWIFLLAAGTMVAGFGFIVVGLGFGVTSVMASDLPAMAVDAGEKTDAVQADAVATVVRAEIFPRIAVVSAASGVMMEFIGATLMVLYRSTMSQADKYLRVLERINAVGMAVQIVESVDHDIMMRNKALVSISEQILGLYAPEARRDAEPGTDAQPADAVAADGSPTGAAQADLDLG